MVYGLEYPFVLAPAFLPPSAYPLWGQSEEQRRPSCYVALFSNSLSSDVSSIVLVTNLKHSTIWAYRKAVNSVPARPRATYLASNWLWWSCEFCVLRQLIQASLQQRYSSAAVLCLASAPQSSASTLCWHVPRDWPLSVHPSSVFQIKCWPKHNKNTLSYMGKSWLISGFCHDTWTESWVLLLLFLLEVRRNACYFCLECWARIKLTCCFYDCRTKQNVLMIHYNLCSASSSVVWGNVSIAIPVLFPCPTTFFTLIN